MMVRADKYPILFLLILAASFLGGCDRMITPHHEQIVKDAEVKTDQGDYLSAISLYESALDDSSRCADIHYQLAVLYDDKLNDPLNALHHFKRYLILNPNGRHAAEVKGFMKRDEVTLLTSLSGDSVITQTEAARLRNENLALRKDLDGRSPKPGTFGSKPAPKAEKAVAANREEPRTYVVQAGDTLFSISQKFYKSSARWKDIRNANRDKIDTSSKLKPGERLMIP